MYIEQEWKLIIIINFIYKDIDSWNKKKHGFFLMLNHDKMFSCYCNEHMFYPSIGNFIKMLQIKSW